MPVHEYECRMQHVSERYSATQEGVVEKIKCPICMEDARKIISRSFKRDVSGYPYVEEHFGEEPMLIESPEHRKRVMREKGLEDWRNPRQKGFPGAWV